MRCVLFLLLCLNIFLAQNLDVKDAAVNFSPDLEIVDNNNSNSEEKGNINENERLLRNRVKEKGDNLNSHNKYSSKELFAKLESVIVLGFWTFSRIWQVLQSSDENYPFKMGTSLHNFYISVFPFVKLFTFLTILVVLYFLMTNLFSVIFKKREKQAFKNIQNGVVITIPNAEILYSSEEAIVLKGRTKRIPDSVNYSQLFNQNCTKSQLQFD